MLLADKYQGVSYELSSNSMITFFLIVSLESVTRTTVSNFKCIGVNQQPIEQRDCFFQHLSIKLLIGQPAVGAVWFIISSLLQDVLASRSIITSVHVDTRYCKMY